MIRCDTCGGVESDSSLIETYEAGNFRRCFRHVDHSICVAHVAAERARIALLDESGELARRISEATGLRLAHPCRYCEDDSCNPIDTVAALLATTEHFQAVKILTSGCCLPAPEVWVKIQAREQEERNENSDDHHCLG